MAQKAAFRRLRGRAGSPPCATTQMALSASLRTCSPSQSQPSTMERAMPVVSTTQPCPPWGAVQKSPWRWQDSLGPPWRTAWASSCLPFSSSGSSKRWAGWLPPDLLQKIQRRRKHSEATHHHPGEAATISGLSYWSSSPKLYTIILLPPISLHRMAGMLFQRIQICSISFLRVLRQCSGSQIL